ncbi:MAG: type II secretion system protein [Lachnospiraceae bacterium]|nr:type II secretion system protein [Lachnospiraceae bacterium]
MRMKKDNRGLSLIEVVIVITILAVLGALMTLGVSVAVSKPADECANKMMTSMNNARVTTMGKQSITLKYYVKNNSIYLDKEIVAETGATPFKETTQIGAKDVKVTYRLKDETDYKDLSAYPMVLSFDRTTGGFKEEHNSGAYVEEIVITKGNRTKILKLMYLTGKVTLE